MGFPLIYTFVGGDKEQFGMNIHSVPLSGSGARCDVKSTIIGLCEFWLVKTWNGKNILKRTDTRGN